MKNIQPRLIEGACLAGLDNRPPPLTAPERIARQPAPSTNRLHLSRGNKVGHPSCGIRRLRADATATATASLAVKRHEMPPTQAGWGAFLLRGNMPPAVAPMTA